MTVQGSRTTGRRRIVAGLLALALVAAACSGAKDADEDSLSAGEPGRAGGVAGPGEGSDATDDGEGDGADGAEAGTEGSDTTAAAGGAGSGGTAAGGGATSGSGATGGAATPGDGFRSTLFSAKEERIGITDEEIRICVHAALTYGAAFNTGQDDLNVYWDAVNDAGGVFGRQVKVSYENDNYQPDTARQAADACKDRHDPFFVVGGIGFDQIPAVRKWAEENRMLYIHHTATVQGTEGQKYSFSALPTTEKMGEMFAELVVARHKDKRVGIVKRRSENWEPGVVGFKRLAAQHGVKIAYEKDVQVNQGNYLQEILALSNADVDLVWLWLNALETTEFVKQARAQAYRPTFMVFPFNLESQTLSDDALDPRMIGVGMYQAYSHHDTSGEFAKYADDIKEFKAHYAKYRPSADLNGVGGDLIFLAWSSFKATHRMLEACGADCTRNRLVEVMHGLRFRPTSSFCEVDFTRAGHGNRGGWQVSVMETYRAPDGRVNWRNTDTCVEHLI